MLSATRRKAEKRRRSAAKYESDMKNPGKWLSYIPRHEPHAMAHWRLPTD
jgi:hypothetical protein